MHVNPGAAPDLKKSKIFLIIVLKL